MSVTYRNGVAGDGKAVAELFRESFIATFGHLYAQEDLYSFLEGVTGQAFEDELASPEFTFQLAEDSGRLAGFVKLGPDNLPGEALPGTIELYQFYVLEPWHGSGIARELMDWAIDESRRQGARYLTLTVYIDNHRARRFYERYGFEEVGKYVFMVGNHADDDRIMRLTL
jgi:ribosomal protein S18 acetylase RimI-like enzyme